MEQLPTSRGRGSGRSEASINRKAITIIAALTLSVSAASAAHAFPVGPSGGSGSDKKGCKAGGKIHDSGSTFTTGGKTYSCNDGIGCQVENGKTTDKCEHMEPLRRPPSGRTSGATTEGQARM